MTVYLLQIESREEIYLKAPKRNSPRIGAFKSSSQYFIYCAVCELPNIRSALFYLFCAYYVFDLEYPKQAQNVFYFLQDYILSYPDSSKRPSTYLAIVSDIKRNL